MGLFTITIIITITITIIILAKICATLNGLGRDLTQAAVPATKSSVTVSQLKSRNFPSISLGFSM